MAVLNVSARLALRSTPADSLTRHKNRLSTRLEAMMRRANR